MITKKKMNTPRQPNALLYSAAAVTLMPFMRLKYGFTVDKTAIKGMKPPFIVLSAHLSNLDFILTGLTMFPVKMNFVTAQYYFCFKPLLKLLDQLGCISKKQFMPDVKAIKSIMKVIARGGSVCIYPAGQVSLCGCNGTVPESIAKLVKKLGVPVIAVRMDGAYLTKPKWGSARRGKIRATATPILTSEELISLDSDAVYSRIADAIAFDEVQDNQTARIAFRGKHLAEGLHNILYKCPRCGKDFSMDSMDDRLFCTACGNDAVLDRYGLLHKVNTDCIVYSSSVDWDNWQRECVKKELQEYTFSLESNVEFRMPAADLRGYESVGKGILVLNRDGITYRGTKYGESVRLFFPSDTSPVLPCVVGDNFEIPHAEVIHCFKLQDGRQVHKWVLANEANFERAMQEFRDVGLDLTIGSMGV